MIGQPSFWNHPLVLRYLKDVERQTANLLMEWNQICYCTCQEYRQWNSLHSYKLSKRQKKQWPTQREGWRVATISFDEKEKHKKGAERKKNKLEIILLWGKYESGKKKKNTKQTAPWIEDWTKNDSNAWLVDRKRNNQAIDSYWSGGPCFVPSLGLDLIGQQKTTLNSSLIHDWAAFTLENILVWHNALS